MTPGANGGGNGRGGGGRNGRSGPPDGVRFLRIELQYGRHARVFELGETDRPFVILGPNGAGKSTLIEGFVRAIYGFARRLKDERETHDHRRPWRADGYRASVTLGLPSGRLEIERDFESDLVVVREVETEDVLFSGEPNPTGQGETARRFRALLEDRIGLAELDDYRRTSCVFQGGLVRTSLSADLLRVAAGGHSDVETARERLLSEYHALTVQSISGGATRRRKPGRVERLAAAVEDLETRVADARRAEARRGPLVRAREEHRRRLGTLESDLARLESAFEILSESRRLEEAAEVSRERVREWERVGRDLDEAFARYDLVRDRARVGSVTAWPLDFLERLAALEDGLWPRARALEEEAEEAAAIRDRSGSPGWVERLLLAGGPALLAVAAACWILGQVAIAGLAGGLAIAATAGWAVRRHARTRGGAAAALRLSEIERERADVDRRVAELKEGVPEASELDAGTALEWRRRYRAELDDRRQLSEGEQALRSAVDAARRALDGVEPGRGIDAVPGGLAERARSCLQAVHAAASNERDEVLAPLKVRLSDIARTRFDLPAGVEPTAAGVREARRACLSETEEVRRALSRVETDLAVAARPEESSLSLAAKLEGAAEELASARARAGAYRRAYALIEEAYDAFRQTDEERLVSAVTAHVKALSGSGALGPLALGEGLDDARIELSGRLVPVEAPPLSFGQLHAVLLAIRMGAADFLAGLGVRLPLLLDDPFVHLDPERAADLWRLLERIARGRQVILATQNALLLEHLGVAADLTLDPPAEDAGQEGIRPPTPEARSASREPSAPARPPSSAERPRPEPPETRELPLDLWDTLDG